MSKKLFSILAAGALIASAFTLAPANAAPEVPSDDDANIVDQPADANYHSSETGSDAGPSLRAADILKVWFTHDDENISAHFQTDFWSSPDSLLYRVWVDPGVGDTCMAIQGVSEGMGNDAQSSLRLLRDCGEGTEEAGEFIAEEGPDETGLWTITLPRSMNDAFQDGGVLATPWADTSHNIPGVVRGAPAIDDTEEGKDYEIKSGGGDTKAQPPGKNNPPGQGNQNCAKIKNKKKKQQCKKNRGKQKGKNKNKNKSKACPAYQPGEMGAEAETIKLNEKATEEDPAIYEFSLDADFSEGLSGDTPEHFVNVQVDTKAGTTGLYALFEFPQRRDYDLWAYWPSGNEAASAHGFNLLAETSGAPGPADQSNTATNHAGETTASSESLVGAITPRCGGYTLGMYNFFGEGGDFELKLWLGEGVEEPKEDGGE